MQMEPTTSATTMDCSAVALFEAFEPPIGLIAGPNLEQTWGAKIGAVSRVTGQGVTAFLGRRALNQRD
jgi:hypothetical protein